MCFDIGANIGNYTEMLINKFKSMAFPCHVHLFEPTKDCFAVLESKFSGNGNVFLNKKAVSDSAESMEIFYDKQLSPLASLYKRNLKAYSLELSESELVETVRLDDYIANHQIRHIHFMKIDIEGHEVAAFKGLGEYLNEDFIDFIQFEYGGANLDSHTSLLDLYSILEKAGFKIAKIMPNGLELRGYQPWMDNFQYANYVAISKKVVDKLK